MGKPKSKFECPECGSTKDTWADGSGFWNCDNCGWCEQDEIDDRNEDFWDEDEDFKEDEE